MDKRLLSLNSREVEGLLKKLGFEFHRQKGSHQQFVGNIGGKRRLVTVQANQSHFARKTMKSMILQSGLAEQDWIEVIR